MTYQNTYSGKSQNYSAIHCLLAVVVADHSLIMAAGSHWQMRDVNYMRSLSVMSMMAKDLVAKSQ